LTGFTLLIAATGMSPHAGGLSILLILFGTGPGTSDAKVNLLGVQPVEAIRLLVVLFLGRLPRFQENKPLARSRPGRSWPR
jgi:hypothetical protein